MRRQFFFGTVFAAAMAVGLGAQSMSQPSSSTQSDNVTVTGCLQSADSLRGSTTGTSGTGSSTATAGSETSPAATTAGAGQFVLTGVSMGSGDASETAPQTATGTSGTSAASSGSDLLLIASSSNSSAWSKYLNHRVEVKGTIEKGSSPSSEPNANPTSTNPTSTNPTSTNPTSTNPTGTSGSTAGTMTGSSTSASSASPYGNSSPNSNMDKFRVSSIKDLGTSCASK